MGSLPGAPGLDYGHMIKGEQMGQGAATAFLEEVRARGLRGTAVRGLEAAAILVMAVEVIVVMAGVISRYVLNRPIADEESTEALAFLASFESPQSREEAWTALCHALLTCNEFLFRL